MLFKKSVTFELSEEEADSLALYIATSETTLSTLVKTLLLERVNTVQPDGLKFEMPIPEICAKAQSSNAFAIIQTVLRRMKDSPAIRRMIEARLKADAERH